jgi:hypothetical protein
MLNYSSKSIKPVIKAEKNINFNYNFLMFRWLQCRIQGSPSSFFAVTKSRGNRSFRNDIFFEITFTINKCRHERIYKGKDFPSSSKTSLE